jgi:DnaJ family protein A protein 2
MNDDILINSTHLSIFYIILEIKPTSNKIDIKKAYHKLAMKNHPDKGGNTENFNKIRRAYDILSDDKYRK